MLHYPKAIMKEEFVAGIISDEDLWVYMLADRNMTSHTYNKKLEDEIYRRISTYVPVMKELLNTIDSSLKNKI